MKGQVKRWLWQTSTAFVYRLPRTLAELTMVAVIAVLLLACWAPGYIGASAENERRRERQRLRRPPINRMRTEVLPAVTPFSSSPVFGALLQDRADGKAG